MADNSTATSAAATLSGTPVASSAGVAQIYDTNGTGNITPPTGYTEVFDLSEPAEGGQIEHAYKLGSGAATLTWTGLQSGPYGRVGVAIEILAGGGGGGTARALAGQADGVATVTGDLTKVGGGTTRVLAGTAPGVATTTAALALKVALVATTGIVLFDDFPGTAIDTTKWTVYNRIGDLANNEVNGVIPANVRVSGGSLFIDSKFEDVTIGDSQVAPRVVHYTSGQIASNMEFLYGRADFRARMPGGTGTWPDLWMLGYGWHPTQAATANDPGSFPESALGEIDIAEFMFNQRSSVNCQIHYNDGSGHVDPGGIVGISFDATSRFIVYRLDWSPGLAVFSVDYEDGSGFHVIQTITGASNVPNSRMYVISSTRRSAAQRRRHAQPGHVPPRRWKSTTCGSRRRPPGAARASATARPRSAGSRRSPPRPPGRRAPWPRSPVAVSWRAPPPARVPPSPI